MRAKRYLVAFGGLVAASIVAGRVSELLVSLVIGRRDMSSDIEYWVAVYENIALASILVQGFVSFFVGAYLLKRSALIPGLVIFSLWVAWNAFITAEQHYQSHAVTTYAQFFTETYSVWLSAFIGAVIGVLLGQYFGARREAARDAL